MKQEIAENNAKGIKPDPQKQKQREEEIAASDPSDAPSHILKNFVSRAIRRHMVTLCIFKRGKSPSIDNMRNSPHPEKRRFHW